MASSSSGQQQPASKHRFISNVIWNWGTAGVGLFTAVVLSRYIVRHLGAEGYAIWVLAFAIVEYNWLFDLGFRSAIVRFTAHHASTGESDQINRVVNTSLLYFSAVAVVVATAMLLFAPQLVSLFQVSEANRGILVLLLRLVCIGWALGIVFNIFTASLEGFQRFDLCSMIWGLTAAIRSVGSVVLLHLGYGLYQMGLLALGTQILGYIASFLLYRRVFPQARFSPRLADGPTLRKLAGYGIHSLTATVGNQLLIQSPTVLIGHLMPLRYVGFYTLPLRMAQYLAEMVCRVGFVTTPKAAENAAQNDTASLQRLAIFVNRYCLMLFLAPAIVVVVYGTAIIHIWMGSEFAAESSPLLPACMLGTTLAIAGQFNASSILYGLGKHRNFAYSLIIEAILSIGLLFLTIPHFGLVGVVWCNAILMILNRGLFTAWLLCSSLDLRFPNYLASIYGRPLLSAVLAFALAFAIKNVVPSPSLAQLIPISAAVGLFYYGIAAPFCLLKEHRELFLERLGSVLAPVLGPLRRRMS